MRALRVLASQYSWSRAGAPPALALTVMMRAMSVSLTAGREMAKVDDLAHEAATGLRALQDLQRLYDDEMWDISDPLFSKLRHIHIHLSNTIGKLARAIEPLDHHDHRSEAFEIQSINEVMGPLVADLLIHAAQISTVINRDLPEVLMDRYRNNAQRFAPESDFTKL
jgi:hypothetical protein